MKITDLLLGLVLGDAMALLKLAQQLVAFASDDVEVIVRQLTPLLFDFSFELQPVPFKAIFVHDFSFRL